MWHRLSSAIDLLERLFRDSRTIFDLLRYHAVAYVGWLGHDNMGDTGMYLAHGRSFPTYHFVTDLPSAAVLRRLTRLKRRPLLLAAVLGGGTLIGWPNYRRTLQDLLSVDDALPLCMLGTGVEDPSFAPHNPLLSRVLVGAFAEDQGSPENDEAPLIAELHRWRPVLERMDAVCVRGPRSQAVLAEVGIASEITGDPALLLADDKPAPKFTEQLLGINIGVARAIWGGRPDILLSRIVDVCRIMRDQGWRLRFVPLWPLDLPYIQDAARQIGSGVEIFQTFRSIEALHTAIRDCHVFVGQKLHSVVFASNVYVPSVMLEYQPKCADFQDSLGRGEFTVRTDRVDVTELIEKVTDLGARRDHHRQELYDAVYHRRQLLQKRVVKIRSLLGSTATSE